ncbi:Uncharacterised protein [Vibrio cholerae]|nr:Uncharacterised protein [Vibrio cholerae]
MIAFLELLNRGFSFAPKVTISSCFPEIKPQFYERFL